MNELDFLINCPICSNEMCEPTTMSCGHSFCRLCTLKWCFHYRNYNCPVCRRQLADKTLPNVNLTLKYLIAVVKERNEQLADVDILIENQQQQQKQSNFDHDYLISKISKNLQHSEEWDEKKTKNEPTMVSHVSACKSTTSDDSTLSRLNILYFPLYLGLTVVGFGFLAFLNLMKRILK